MPSFTGRVWLAAASQLPKVPSLCAYPSSSWFQALLRQGVMANGVVRCWRAYRVQEAVVDTTGAGDAFVGSLIYSLATGLGIEATLRLGAVVAACKCTALGARPGLPWRSQLSPEVLPPL